MAVTAAQDIEDERPCPIPFTCGGVDRDQHHYASRMAQDYCAALTPGAQPSDKALPHITSPGIFNDDGSVNTPLVNRISGQVRLSNVIWEAPLKSQQAWFIRHFGPDVNLGNIAPSEIIPLETLRLGLRGDTFFQFLPEGLTK